jgi:hypothetical protein
MRAEVRSRHRLAQDVCSFQVVPLTGKIAALARGSRRRSLL